MTVWDALVGQSRAVSELAAAARVGRAVLAGEEGVVLAHSWLITGPPGSGRSVAAKCFAAALQCTGSEVGCGVCPGCHTTMVGSNLDVLVAATDLVQISIADVREWLALAQQRPTHGRWRVIIVEDADRMTERTSNLLLKALEEPPPRTVWVLCAPTPSDLLITIRSRCRHLQLGTPAVQAVAELLAGSEDVPLAEARLAAQVSQSHVGVARAIVRDPDLRAARVAMFLDLLRADSVGAAVVAAGHTVDAAKAAGLEESAQRDAEEMAALQTALGVGDGKRIPPALRSQIRDLEKDQERRKKRSLADALDRVMVDLLGFFRDVMVLQVGALSTLVNADLEDAIRQFAGTTSLGDTLRRTEAIRVARTRLGSNAAPLLIVEALGVALFDPHLAKV